MAFVDTALHRWLKLRNVLSLWNCASRDAGSPREPTVKDLCQLYELSVHEARLHSERPVLIYQMGKVGSSSIASALRANTDFSVFSLHYMFPQTVDRMLENIQNKQVDLRRHPSLLLGRAIFDGLICAGIPLRIITLVREPIARNMSAYFQNLYMSWDVDDAHCKFSTEELVGRFLKKSGNVPLTWFDEEFNKTLQIDVYRHAFSTEKKWGRIGSDLYDVLILRTDLPDEDKQRCIEEFLARSPIHLARRNVGTSKDYADAYERFVKQIRLPEAYVTKMLDSRYTRHFFSAREVAVLRSKWMGR